MPSAAGELCCSLAGLWHTVRGGQLPVEGTPRTAFET